MLAKEKKTVKMGFELWKNSTEFAQLIVLTIFTPIGIGLTVLRFVAAYRGMRKPGLEDWMAVLAALFFMLTNLGALIAISILNGRQIAEEVAQSPLDYEHMRKWDIAALYFYFAHTLSVKLSVLALYYRIFSVNRPYRIWIYLLGAAQTVLFIIFCIFQALQCRPFNRYFDLSIPGTCTDEGTVIIGGETPNSLIDFAMVILAMFMIRPLQLSSAMKWRLRVLFGLGALVGIIGFIKIAITYSPSNLYAFSMVSIWTCVQMFVSLLCCCLPVLHPILPTAAFWSRFSSHMVSYMTFRRASGARTTTQSAKESSNGKGFHRTREPRLAAWEYLEDNSARGLSWPEATHQTDTYALREHNLRGAHSESHSILVERRFDVV
ncbi:hypothetical protein F4813DRAFT_345443 [Daldinia decipiens]|uniref:uncharacterized protein n=1 Tax=Daldinia decipiens TaxID=326647 RepID=UPI0020C1E61D|nr:uncharacterized protein F4813DRAFT_345443 [Daldinia decipiens]KAI1661696.1 hypothetical protein F4813DRAFT_345443 [Daldinia decipiens]